MKHFTLVDNIVESLQHGEFTQPQLVIWLNSRYGTSFTNSTPSQDLIDAVNELSGYRVAKITEELIIK